MNPSEMSIRVQSTPNPMAFKFVVPSNLKSEGKATFTSIAEAQDVSLPLVESIFTIGGVQQVYLSQNTMTVTHTGTVSDEDLVQQVEAVLQTRMSVHNPDFKMPSERVASAPDRSQMSPERRQVEEILDRTVRPGLQADGGDIEIIRFENNEVQVLYQGACGGCPSSMMGTLDAIQGILQNELQNPHIVVTPI